MGSIHLLILLIIISIVVISIIIVSIIILIVILVPFVCGLYDNQSSQSLGLGRWLLSRIMASCIAFSLLRLSDLVGIFVSCITLRFFCLSDFGRRL